MQLHSSDLSPFARKCRMLILEHGLEERVRVVDSNPYEASDALLKANPLSRVPVLVLDDGSTLYDSAVICDFLDNLVQNPLMPQGDDRWPAARQLALCDGLMEATFNIACEFNRRPENERSATWVARWVANIERGLDELEVECRSLGDTFSLPHIGAVAALEYLDLRASEHVAWRMRRPALVAWLGTHGSRPAAVATRPQV